MKKNKIIYHTLDLLFLMASYMLCDFVAEKTNLLLGIIMGLISYIVVGMFLCKGFNIQKN